MEDECGGDSKRPTVKTVQRSGPYVKINEANPTHQKGSFSHEIAIKIYANTFEMKNAMQWLTAVGQPLLQRYSAPDGF